MSYADNFIIQLIADENFRLEFKLMTYQFFGKCLPICRRFYNQERQRHRMKKASKYLCDSPAAHLAARRRASTPSLRASSSGDSNAAGAPSTKSALAHNLTWSLLPQSLNSPTSEINQNQQTLTEEIEEEQPLTERAFELTYVDENAAGDDDNDNGSER